jgi:hypothetical protein
MVGEFIRGMFTLTAPVLIAAAADVVVAGR